MALPANKLITINDRGARAATTFGSVSAGGANMVFIKKLTADGSGTTLDFVDGASDVVLDGTYKEYVFTFNNMHPQTDKANFQFQVDTGTNTNYNQTITSTFFVAYNNEDTSTAGLAYDGNNDQAQGTAFQDIAKEINGDNDGCGSGTLHLFNPSSTTFVKHFICRSQVYVAPSSGVDFSQNMHFAGYVNTTTALTRVRFQMSSGNIDAGDICLYGIL